MAQSPTPSLTAPRGFRAAGGVCGIKPSGKPDLALIVADRPCVAAAVFTKNRVPGAPVIVGKRRLRGGQAQAVIVNSGIANDATGQQGVDNALHTTEIVAGTLRQHGHKIDAKHVVPSSTGLIGPQLPMEKIRDGITEVVPRLQRGIEADEEAARGIMTTDLMPKQAKTSKTIGGKRVTIGGIAKGSGMIAPNLATMLVFLTTDAVITRGALKSALNQSVAVSFNRISVDAHTSPSDTVLVLASEQAGNKKITSPGKDLDLFTAALTQACKELAYKIVEDGEGATRIFRLTVAGAASQREADKVGRCVIDSPLVKCAVHGGDPNWGRIVTAAGNSGVPLTPEKMSLFIGGTGTAKGKDRGTCVYDHGVPKLDKIGADPKLAEAMQQKEVLLRLELGRGDAEVQWLGCDLSREYVKINADYTT